MYNKDSFIERAMYNKSNFIKRVMYNKRQVYFKGRSEGRGVQPSEHERAVV
ncbi:TPA: hypothetical protein ACY4QG_003215 [Vibrio parahaemolyticus]